MHQMRHYISTPWEGTLHHSMAKGAHQEEWCQDGLPYVARSKLLRVTSLGTL
jgi:hypothetical protein